MQSKHHRLPHWGLTELIKQSYLFHFLTPTPLASKSLCSRSAKFSRLLSSSLINWSFNRQARNALLFQTAHYMLTKRLGKWDHLCSLEGPCMGEHTHSDVTFEILWPAVFWYSCDDSTDCLCPQFHRLACVSPVLYEETKTKRRYKAFDVQHRVWRQNWDSNCQISEWSQCSLH